MTHLVTGGAGFIGNHIVRALVARGERVRILDNFATGHRENVADLGDVELVEGDVRSLDTCRRAAAGTSFVLHHAALPSVPRSIEDPFTSHEVNATGTLNVLIAAKEAGVRRVVYASSSSVYGPEPKLPRDETDRPYPISPYAVAKLTGEQYCGAFFKSYGLETVSLRYFNVFGPRQGWDSPYAAVLPRFIRALHDGSRPRIFGDGEQVRDFTYVANVVDANLLALIATSAPGRTYNVAAGKKTSVNQLLTLTRKAMNTNIDAEYLPPRTGDLRDSLASVGRAAADLGYEPKWSLEQGLGPTIEWARQQLR